MDGSAASIQELFFSWATEEVLPQQVMELRAVLHPLCVKLEELCAQKGFMNVPLFECADPSAVQRVIDAATGLEEFRSDQRGENRLFTVLNLYHEFLMEQNIHQAIPNHGLYVELGKAIEKGNTPHLCGRWFLHEQGDRAMYCDCIAPGEANKTCREAGARAVFEKKSRRRKPGSSNNARP